MATLPDPIILSAESGVLSLGHVRIPQITISTYKEMDEAYNFLKLSEHAKQFKSVALDSISEIAEQCLRGEKAVSKDGRRAYGEMGDQMRELIRKFRDLPGKHVYFSAKQGYNKDDVTGISRYGPNMPGQSLTQDMPYFFDELFALDHGVVGQVDQVARRDPDELGQRPVPLQPEPLQREQVRATVKNPC